MQSNRVEFFMMTASDPQFLLLNILNSDRSQIRGMNVNHGDELF